MRGSSSNEITGRILLLEQVWLDRAPFVDFGGLMESVAMRAGMPVGYVTNEAALRVLRKVAAEDEQARAGRRS